MKRCFLSIIMLFVFSASVSAQNLNDVQSACDTLVLLTNIALQSAENGEASSYTRAAQSIRSRTGDDCRSNYFHEVANRYPDIPYVCTPRRAEAATFQKVTGFIITLRRSFSDFTRRMLDGSSMQVCRNVGGIMTE